MAGALDGLLVIDLTQNLAGPYATMILADLGARVIKVERPGAGDDTRRMGPFLNGESGPFLAVNRNKESLSLDLKAAAGRQIVLDLARRGDVLVENMRAGTARDLGIDYDTLREINPKLIYCSISGFGQTGPYRERGGYDLIAQGMAGILASTGDPGGGPVKVSIPICDIGAAMWATQAILAAYVNRLKTGKGQFVETSLLESGVAWGIWEAVSYWLTGEVPRRTGSAHRLAAPCQAFATATDHIIVCVGNEKLFRDFAKAIGKPELIEDPRFQSPAQRIANVRALASEIEAALRTRPATEWLAVINALGIPCGPVYAHDQVYDDPQVQDREMVQWVDHPRAGQHRVLATALKFSDTPPSIRSPAPLLGQHTDQVLAWLGYDRGQIAKLREDRVV